MSAANFSIFYNETNLLQNKQNKQPKKIKID